MKKFIAFLAVAAFAVAFVACGKKNEEATAPAADTTATAPAAVDTTAADTTAAAADTTAAH